VLIAYEASHDEALSLGGTLPGMAATNRREAIQVRNLTRALAALPTHAKLLVWCGNGHLGKTPVGDWMPMGYQVQVQSGIMPFAIDQTRSVLFPRLPDAARASAERLVDAYTPQLLRLGGTAGWLTEEAPHHLRRTFEDAFLLSVHNAPE